MPQQFNKEVDDLFGQITIDINWRALLASGATSSSRTLTLKSTPTLRQVLLPWYTRDGEPVIHCENRVDRKKFSHPLIRLPQSGDRPLSIGDAADASDDPHPWYKPGSILSKPPLMGRFPAYDVGAGLLLLDGNHRCISIVRTGADYSIDLVVIHGPIDPRIMHDLAVFTAA